MNPSTRNSIASASAAAHRERADYARARGAVEDGAGREEVVAYRVSHKYHGRHDTRSLPYDPGERLPVNVNVEPARW